MAVWCSLARITVYKKNKNLLVPATAFDFSQLIEHRLVAAGPVGLDHRRSELVDVVVDAGQTAEQDVQIHRVVFGVVAVVAESEIDQKRPVADADVPRRRIA